ncbi:hypothetical protein NK553_28625 [Pseudomonas sp. ZM23]|uniref:Uncharacterized protein n=1 Tax=Pseudomonas triclosanedens TaxID=2961893 RepID=A0ABY7A5C4_9PSED|nr:hypothetical protein [Pseudomonas triclosanedens]MCP8467918.1 hypothetical protein [Pseudomonas triclosanedens]MCP8473894.1 hypothetical protein [Pseudomonas triclosanedens]MCP8479888.1 hypothetical protein [Pseudomonas triclosanedens]WAI51309.1 hypothetical protein OU419_08670 [Pseudomonas triclosanedens]
MQFELTALCLNVKKITVEGRTYCSAIIAREPMTEQERLQNRGYLVQKVTAEPSVFDQITDLDKPGQRKFIATLVNAAGGKSQPHLLGVVPMPSNSKAAA